jgi:hypothetical protein
MVVATAVVACAPPPPVVAPMPGCYAVMAEPWSPAHAYATGLRSLPPVIGIDSNTDRQTLVPPDWRLQKPEFTSHSDWSDWSFEWKLRGDSVLETWSGKYHKMAADSLMLRFHGWAGAVTAFLAPTPNGFEGSMQMTSLTQTTVPRARLSLSRRDCGGLQLMSSGGPNKSEPPRIP